VAVGNVPVPLLRRIDTLLLPELATARSSLPSPLKSPIATECGFDPVAKLAAVEKDA
jgi:hypothetical protein